DDGVWDEYGEAFDLLDTEADAFIASMDFPGGLYWVQTSTGNLQPQGVVIAYRYRELDEFDAPITTGGANGDGYVRLPQQVVLWTSRNRVQVEYRADFVDPQAWTPPTLGKSLVTNGAAGDNAQLVIAGATLPTEWLAGSALDVITVEGWVKLNNLSTVKPWFAWASPNGTDGPAATGFMIRFRSVGYFVNQTLVQRVRPDVWCGNGGSSYTKLYSS